MSVEYSIRGAAERGYAEHGSALPTPGKRTLTQGLNGPKAGELLGQVRKLYKALRGLLKTLSGTDTGPGGTAQAQTLDTLFRTADETLAALGRKNLDADQRGEAEEMEWAIGDLYRKAVPIMVRHGIRRPTDVGIIDRGTGCEADPKQDGCYLSDAERTRHLTSLSHLVGDAMRSFSSALGRAQLELMTSDEDSWGFLAEFLFYTGSGAIIGGALKALRAVKAAASPKTLDALDVLRGADEAHVGAFLGALTKVPEEAVSTVLVNASRGVRAELKTNAKKAGPGTKGKVAFLRIVEGRLGAISKEVALDAPATLDDVGLAALVAAYADTAAHTPDVYEAAVNGLLARYANQRVGEAGDRRDDGGSMRPVVLEAYGQRRAAMLEDHGTSFRYFDGPADLHIPIYGDGRQVLVAFLDEEMAALADQINAAKGGGPTETIVVTGSQGFDFGRGVSRDELEAWVESAKQKQADASRVTVTPLPQVTVTHIEEEP